MYIDNKYTNIYYSIVNRAKNRTLATYKERHHIIPKSLGGNNDRSNIVDLTAREHFICHLLLTKMTSGNNKKKMSYALWLMCNLKNQNQSERYSISSKLYDLIRNNHSHTVSESFKGKKKGYSSFGGKKHTEKTLKIQREVKLGNKNPNYGVQQKPEWNKKKSEAQKGIAKPQIKCEHCNKSIGGHSNYFRWHGDNCKLNTKTGETSLPKN
jgi:hypothetical protein